MKNKKYLLSSIFVISCLILISSTVVYIYIADRLDPKLLNYYASDKSDKSQTGVISKIKIKKMTFHQEDDDSWTISSGTIIYKILNQKGKGSLLDFTTN
jgi:hypothetical protein